MKRAEAIRSAISRSANCSTRDGAGEPGSRCVNDDLAWLFLDERNEASQSVARRVAAAGGVVPVIWRLEVANVLRSAVRRARCDEAYAMRSLRRLERLRIVTDGWTDRQAWGPTRELSLRHNLTMYNAAYLELAVRRREQLASRDGALIAAARSCGIEVIGA